MTRRAHQGFRISSRVGYSFDLVLKWITPTCVGYELTDRNQKTIAEGDIYPDQPHDVLHDVTITYLQHDARGEARLQIRAPKIIRIQALEHCPGHADGGH